MQKSIFFPSGRNDGVCNFTFDGDEKGSPGSILLMGWMQELSKNIQNIIRIFFMPVAFRALKI